MLPGDFFFGQALKKITKPPMIAVSLLAQSAAVP
jgi:hypothetical protein